MVKIKVRWPDIIALIFFLLAIYLILTIIFGHSATPIEVTVTLFGGLAFLVYRINREVGEVKISIKYGFKKIKEDMDIIKGNMDLIKRKLKI